MNNLTGTVLLIVALVVGWLIGAQTGGGDADATNDEIVRLQEENTRLRRTLGERGPTLQPRVGLESRKDPDQPDGPKGSSSKTSAPRGDVTAFDVTQFDDPDRAFQTLLAYAHTMLGKGEEGHLALLETMHTTFHERDGQEALEKLVGDEDDAARYLYPMLRFALNHDAQIVDMTETLFRTMAQDARRLEKIDNDVIELFTEGVAVMLPGMVDEKRLDRFRGYAMRILKAPQAEQPRSVQRQRHDIQRAIESWAPPLTAEDALARLRKGPASPEEAMLLLRRLGPEDIVGLDLDALIGPLLEKDGWRFIGLIGRLRPDKATIAKFDARFHGAIATGKLPAHMVTSWLRWTGRRTWKDGREFIEAGLQGGSVKTNGAFLRAALDLRPGPDDEWVEWVERTYDLDDNTRLLLKRRRAKRDG